MELIFVHGWGFDAHFWNGLSARLSQFPQHRVDLGFFGKPVTLPDIRSSAILIGHSLGFIHGLRQKKDWAGWVAINSFPRFVQAAQQTGCVPAAALREMRVRLGKDPAETLREFHEMIGTEIPHGELQVERLREGLDELRDADVGDALKNAPGLVLASRNDPLVPAAASEELGHEAQKMLWHEAGGHALPQSDPDWCARVIEEFLASFSMQERKRA